MSSIIVVFPKKEIATNIRNILVRNGFDVIGVGVTGAQAVQLADNLDDGIVVCGYKMTDMLYNELRDYLSSTIEMLLIASTGHLEDSSRFCAMVAVRSFRWTGAFSGGMPSISSALKTFQ